MTTPPTYAQLLLADTPFAYFRLEAGGATNLCSTQGLIDIGVWQHVAFIRRATAVEIVDEGTVREPAARSN
jgi:hypothetical protein